MNFGLRSLGPDAAAAQERLRAAALAVFSRAGFALVETSVVTPAEVFLDRLGENFRGQTCFFEDGAGTELCLRPEMTIPVCQMALDAGYDGAGERRFAYAGSVFRLGANGAGALTQSGQAGVEHLGAADDIAADAGAIRLAREALAACGIADASVTLGDAAAFRALVEALALTPRQRAHVLALFEAHGSGLVAHLPATADERPMRALDLDLARAQVEERLEAEGLTLTGRDVDDVARRLAARAERRAAAFIPAEARAALKEFFALNCALEAAPAVLDALLAGAGADTAPARRLSQIAAALAGSGARFDASVHAPLGYYTGLEFRIEKNGKALAGGGRYDGLIGLIAKRPDWCVPAVGFALFLDAIEAAR
jgi:ATP phosphoribosyltransferase regulatory subunit